MQGPYYLPSHNQTWRAGKSHFNARTSGTSQLMTPELGRGQLGLGPTMPRRIDVSLLAIHRVVPAATRHGGVAPRRHVELTENAEGVLV